MKKYYAGIGSRQSPDNILEIMTKLAVKLESEGWTLRSGGAARADKAFEAGAGENKEIFLADDATDKAMDYAAEHHPAWHYCNAFVRKLHGRNAMIVLGRDLNLPSEIVYCWTKNAALSGGTAMGIRIANSRHIIVKNLGDPIVLEEIKQFLGDAYVEYKPRKVVDYTGL